LQRIIALEKSSQEHLNKINLLQARVDTLEEDKALLEGTAHKLQEKTKPLTKEKKGSFSSFGLVVVASSFFVFYAYYCLVFSRS